VVVLDVSPTLAVRVRSVVEVADVARAPFFLLPPGLGDTLARLSRGAVLHKDRLYLEINAEALPHRALSPAPPPRPPVAFVEFPPDRALVFESQERLFGIPLSLVSQVVARGEAFSRLPGEGGAVAGIFPHAQVLWPICSAPALLGAPAAPEAFFVLTELAGRHVGLCATRVLGVVQRFVATPERGEFSAPGLPTPVLFLDLQRMFS
jgi:chemotaxis signal transduction protein